MPADAQGRLYTSQSGVCKSGTDVRGVARPWSIAAMASRVLHHPRCPDPLDAIDAPPAQAYTERHERVDRAESYLANRVTAADLAHIH